MESSLILSRGGFPPLSARGCVQYLMPVESGSLRRTVNGKLVYTGKASEYKYRSVVFCEDKSALALEGLWRGEEVRVGCIHRLSHKAVTPEVLLERDPVEGSVNAITSRQQAVKMTKVQGRIVTLEQKDSVGDIFVSYRPWLDMRIVNFTFITHEWSLKAGWRITLEEI